MDAHWLTEAKSSLCGTEKGKVAPAEDGQHRGLEKRGEGGFWVGGRVGQWADWTWKWRDWPGQLLKSPTLLPASLALHWVAPIRARNLLAQIQIAPLEQG